MLSTGCSGLFLCWLEGQTSKVSGKTLEVSDVPILNLKFRALVSEDAQCTPEKFVSVARVRDN